MRVELSATLREAVASRSLAGVTTYNRIDGPGCSPDLRKSQQAFRSLADIPEDLKAGSAATWTRQLPRTVGIMQVQSNVVFRGVTDYVWSTWGLPGRADSGYGFSLRYELVLEEDHARLEQRVTTFHTGSSSTSSSDLTTVQTKEPAGEPAQALHQRRLEVADRFRDGLRRRNWEESSAATWESRQARTRLSAAYLCGARGILRSGCRYAGAALLSGGDGCEPMFDFCPQPDVLRQARHRLTSTFDQAELKTTTRSECNISKTR